MLEGNKKITDDTPIMSITVAADMLGVHSRTLMLYEYEKLIVIKRNPQKHRIYSMNDLRNIKFIQYLTRKKRLNFAGIRIVLAMIKKAEEHNVDLKSMMFHDFKPD